MNSVSELNSDSTNKEIEDFKRVTNLANYVMLINTTIY